MGVIFLMCGSFFNVNMNHILLNKGLILVKKLNTRFKKQNFRSLFFLLFLATNYNNSKIISEFLAIVIKKNKNHHKILKFYVDFIEFLFNVNLIKMLGLQLRVTGKLDGKLRKSKYHYKLGKVSLQKLNVGISYSKAIS